MKTFYDKIILSPHLDDGTMSCGGAINTWTTTGESVLVVTIMAGDPHAGGISDYVRSLHDRWQLDNMAAERRREEDAAACRVLGADYLHWPVPDCIYRTDPQNGEPYYVSDEDLFGEIQPGEKELVGELIGKMAELPQHNQCYVPLGVGNHVDHQLTRQAAERVFVKSEMVYYEEFPYTTLPKAFEKVKYDDSWFSEVIRLSTTALTTKIEAIAAYQSQLSTFFQDYNDLDRQVRNYAATVGGERYWRWKGYL